MKAQANFIHFSQDFNKEIKIDGIEIHFWLIFSRTIAPPIFFEMKRTRFVYFQYFSFQKDSDIGLVISGKVCDLLTKRMLANIPISTSVLWKLYYISHKAPSFGCNWKQLIGSTYINHKQGRCIVDKYKHAGCDCFLCLSLPSDGKIYSMVQRITNTFDVFFSKFHFILGRVTCISIWGVRTLQVPTSKLFPLRKKQPTCLQYIKHTKYHKK